MAAAWPTTIWDPETAIPRGVNMSDVVIQTDIVDAQNDEIVAIETDLDAEMVRRSENSTVPPGTIIQGIWPSAPAGYLLLAGQTVIGAESAHPALWAVAPNGWKSGSNLVLPNSANRVLFGGGTIGDAAGSNNRTLSTANLPAHSHSINHGHTASTGQDGVHSHIISGRSASTPGGTQSAMGASTTGGTYTIGTGPSVSHNHSVTVNAHSGSSGSVGSGNAFDIVPAHIRIRMAVKT